MSPGRAPVPRARCPAPAVGGLPRLDFADRELYNTSDEMLEYMMA